MKRLVYADNAATTRMSRRAIDAMTSFLSEEYANPSQPYSSRERQKHCSNQGRLLPIALGLILKKYISRHKYGKR